MAILRANSTWRTRALCSSRLSCWPGRWDGVAHGDLGSRSGAGTRSVVTAVSPPAQRVSSAARLRLPQRQDADDTPGKLRLLLVGLIVLSLAWGAIAAWVVDQRASGAGDVVSISEPLSLDGQQIYRSLSDADATAATAFLSGGLEPQASRQRYLADIAAASARLEDATAIASHSLASADLATLSAGLPVYTGEVETARADNRLGLPLGAAYLREASSLMRGKLLPAARNISAQAAQPVAGGQRAGDRVAAGRAPAGDGSRRGIRAAAGSAMAQPEHPPQAEPRACCGHGSSGDLSHLARRRAQRWPRGPAARPDPRLGAGDRARAGRHRGPASPRR